MDARNRKPIAIFLFIPFCKIKCTYCDFNAYANMARLMVPYGQAVSREIIRWGLRRVGSSEELYTAPTVYFGGGTPSLLPVSEIAGLLKATDQVVKIQRDAEITLEANPGTLSKDSLREIRSLGINRLSLGVQSFDDSVLRRLNRGHTVADVYRTLDNARSVGFDNINVDLIYGLPQQTLEDWNHTIKKALELKSEHLSLYALAVEEGTGLQAQITRGKYPRPDDDLAADMYILAEEELGAAGYDHYEISNWARGDGTSRPAAVAVTGDWPDRLPALASRHNLTYWLNEPYLGFGAGAHSCFNGRRYWNVLAPIEYIRRIESDEETEFGGEEIYPDLQVSETIILGLRLCSGVDLEGFQSRFGFTVDSRFGKELDDLVGLGLVSRTPSAIRLTRRGRLLSNQVFIRFLPD